MHVHAWLSPAVIPFAIYNIVAFLMPGVSWTGADATSMVSGGDWSIR